MLKHFCCILFLFCAQTVFAQNLNKVTIKGQAKDTLGEAALFSTVMLLNPKDSALINFTRSDDQGYFAFKNVKNVPYLLKISYVGHIPLQKYVTPSTTEVNDLGILTLKPITKELLEVVIKAAKSTLSIKGDTIEYDASSFKVPPGSTVEDLLRRLPGIEVDADGNIKAQGRDVKRVYVDGKTFFGDDPKAATKNLGAETLSKVQVYNEKSEQAQLTGVDDGKKVKAMNLELKDEYKKGQFGKITGAVGSDERWAARGNYNRFNKKEQFSIIGYGNNINQTGLNWDDYGEFKGQNTFSEFDNADFGFSNGSGGRVFYFGGDDGPLNYFDGRGFTKNFGGGTNYNFDTKKNKFNVNYFYNETRLNLDQISLRQTFLQDTFFFNSDTTAKEDFRGNHSLSTRFVSEIDSNNTVVIKAKGRFNLNNTLNRQSQLFSSQLETPVNNLVAQNNKEMDSWTFSGTAVYRHKFKKKGRSFAVSSAYNGNSSDALEDIQNSNRFLSSSTLPELIRQQNQNQNASNQLKSSALFTESIHKRWFLETFYNFSNTDNDVNRQVQNPAQGQRIDSLSVFYINDIRYNRLGSSIRYSYEGANLSFGMAAQQIQLRGEYSLDEGLPRLADPINRKFNNLTPNVDLNYEFKNNVSLGATYGLGINEPQLSQLQPVPNVNNPAFKILGNPNLSPERSQDFGLNLNYWNQANMSSVGFYVEYSLLDNQIVENQTIEEVTGIGTRITSRPENVDGGRRLNSNLWSNFPIVKTKLTMSPGFNLNFNNSPVFVNGVENETQSRGYTFRLRFNYTPNAKLIIGASGSVGFRDVEYSIQQNQNQKIQNHNTDASIKWQFASKFFLESNFNYQLSRNDRFNFRQDIPILNASVRRLLGRENRVEMRLAAFDLFNRRVSVSQSGSQNFVTRSVANTLARYFMLSVSYNVRGYENKLKKNDWW